jgi:hypothetical protein
MAPILTEQQISVKNLAGWWPIQVPVLAWVGEVDRVRDDRVRMHAAKTPREASRCCPAVELKIPKTKQHEIFNREGHEFYSCRYMLGDDPALAGEVRS